MTPEERYRYLQLKQKQGQGQPQAAPEVQKEAEPWYEDFGEGVGSSLINTGYGLKSLFTDLTPENRATMKDWEEDAAESGWGTAGRVVGEIGQIAVPGGALLKVGKLGQLGKGIQGLTKAAPLRSALAADTVAGMGHGAAQLPDEGDSRLGNALQSGAFSLGGGALTKALSVPLKGFARTPAAQKMLDKGIALTPAQASESAIPNILELATQLTPLSSGTKWTRQNALRQWNRQVMKDAAPTGFKRGFKSDDPQKINDALDKSFTDAYNKAWGKAGNPDEDIVLDLYKAASKQAQRLDERSGKALMGAADDVIDVTVDPTPEKIRRLDKELRNRIKRAFDDENHDLANAIGDMRAGVRESVSKEARKDLIKVDKKFPQFLAIQRAATQRQGLMEAGEFSPEALGDAAKAVGGRGKAFKAIAPLLDVAREGKKTVGRELPPFLANFRKATVQQAPPLKSLMQAGGRAMLGQTKAQKSTYKTLKPLIDELRKRGGRSGVVSPALFEE